jgi:pimeloyl-ACP methyl ester carboxylesterase
MTSDLPDDHAGAKPQDSAQAGFEPDQYDEFGLFAENAEELGIPFHKPFVTRVSAEIDDGRRLSALKWRDSPPELVFLHGGAQNAHTWDSVALILERPMLAIDLPGHGHSDAARDGLRAIDGLAADVAVAITALAPDAAGVIGMSLGGLTSIALVASHPQLVRRHVLVDITPGVTGDKSRAITDFISGPESFDSFEDILERTIEFNPGRSERSLRRGVLHNAVQRADGRWVWRWARHRTDGPMEVPDFAALWDALGKSKSPLLLIRGMRPSSVIDDADEAELKRRRPDARIEHVADAGHSVQGDDPLKLAALISDFIP